MQKKNSKKINKISIFITSISISFIIFSSFQIYAQDPTTINISSLNQTIEKEEQFHTVISIIQSEPIIMIQIDLSFDSNIIQCTGVSNGNPSVWDSFFSPIIDNDDGEIRGACVAVLGDTISTPTDCFNITFISKNIDGASILSLHDILLTNATGVQITSITSTDEIVLVGNGTIDDIDTNTEQNDTTPSDNDNNPPKINHIPTITEDLLGPTTISSNTSYNYSVIATDDDNDDIYYKFDWGDSSYQTWYGPYQSNIACTQDHQWNLTGVYEIKVKLKDSNNDQTDWISSLTITVENETQQSDSSENEMIKPSVFFIFTPTSPKIGDTVTFQDESYDSDGNITKRFWNFGDESTSIEKNQTHSYEEPGKYNVTLTIWDDDNLVNSLKKEIIVKTAQSEKETDNDVNNDNQTLDFTVISLLIAILVIVVLTKRR